MFIYPISTVNFREKKRSPFVGPSPAKCPSLRLLDPSAVAGVAACGSRKVTTTLDLNLSFVLRLVDQYRFRNVIGGVQFHSIDTAFSGSQCWGTVSRIRYAVLNPPGADILSALQTSRSHHHSSHRRSLSVSSATRPAVVNTPVRTDVEAPIGLAPTLMRRGLGTHHLDPSGSVLQQPII